ncbi:MAG: phage major capsid protein [Chloroflexi bacterium]|nr:phage major capsid protein [Chloroflexota bacterium]
MRNKEEIQMDLVHASKSMEDIKARALADGERAFTTDEKKEILEFKEDVTRLDAEMEELREHMELVEKIDKQATRMSTPVPRKVAPVQPIDPNVHECRTIEPGSYRGTPITAFTRHESRADNMYDAYKVGNWVMSRFFGNQKADRWCQNNGLEARYLQEAVNTKGGYLVPEEMSAALIDLREKHGVFRANCNVLPMASDVLTIPRTVDDLTTYFVAEGTSITESELSFDSVTLVAKKLAILTRISSELSEDAVVDIGQLVTRKMGLAIAKKEDQCGFIGDGTATYGSMRGINVKIIDGTHTAGAVDAATNHDTFAEIDAADLTKAMGACPTYALDNAKWYCSALCKSMVFDRLGAAGGGNTIATLAGPSQSSYLGYPIVTSSIMPAGAATDYSNLVMLLFGDLSLSSSLGDSRATRIMESEHRYMELDLIGMKATVRFDINNHDLGNNTDAGPIVALVGE